MARLAAWTCFPNSNTNGIPGAVAVQPDDKIVIAGHFTSAGSGFTAAGAAATRGLTPLVTGTFSPFAIKLLEHY